MKIGEINNEAWEEWILERPECIHDLCRRFPPNILYKLNGSGNRVTVCSYNEAGTLTVDVSGEYNSVTFERQVFGVKPEDLTECDLPADDEILGAWFTEDDEILGLIEIMKQQTKTP